jgi:hypothetical protein
MDVVYCYSQEIDLDGDYLELVPGLCITCGFCGHEVEVYGVSDRSARRGLVMLREECPLGERNWYVCEGD